MVRTAHTFAPSLPSLPAAHVTMGGPARQPSNTQQRTRHRSYAAMRCYGAVCGLHHIGAALTAWEKRELPPYWDTTDRDSTCAHKETSEKPCRGSNIRHNSLVLASCGSATTTATSSASPSSSDNQLPAAQQLAGQAALAQGKTFTANYQYTPANSGQNEPSAGQSTVQVQRTSSAMRFDSPVPPIRVTSRTR